MRSKHKSIEVQSASHIPLSTTNLLTEFSDLFQTKNIDFEIMTFNPDI